MDRNTYSAGMPVQFRTYPTTHKIHAAMLHDVDRWVQDHINDDYLLLP